MAIRPTVLLLVACAIAAAAAGLSSASPLHGRGLAPHWSTLESGGGRLGSYNENVTCVPDPSANATDVKNALTWVCSSGGIDCAPIQPGGNHYEPNTVTAHATWAFTTYFAANPAAESCDFGGTSHLQCGPRDWERVRGVDLGGWLVLEPYIKPSLFVQFENKSKDETAQDEFTFSLILGEEEATKQLTAHWDSWITEKDFANVASMGLNTVRLPIGYWVFGDFPPFIGSISYVDFAVETAAKYNLSVLLDLHGAPGSQNGFDNSGLTCGTCAGICPPSPTWWLNATYIDTTVDVLTKLATRYANATNILGIELLNEPRWDINASIVKDFYLRGYAAVKAVAPEMKVIIHDSFRYNLWEDFMTPSQGYPDVTLDTHVYESFNPSDIQNTPDGHLLEACGYSHMIDFMECVELPVITGEWSLATTDCQQWLDGFEINATAPGLGVPCPHVSTDEFLRDYAAAQISTWERGHGWIFWTLKTETASYWSYYDAVDNGWIPADVSSLPSNVTNYCPGSGAYV